MHPHQIHDLAAIKQFVLGGRAVFTIVSKRTSERATFKVKRAKNAPLYFVSVRTNPEQFAYMGYLKEEDHSYNCLGSKVTVHPDDTRQRVFSWVIRSLFRDGKQPLTDVAEFWHEGRCCRCGRSLTVPESIERGLGPECAGKTARN